MIKCFKTSLTAYNIFSLSLTFDNLNITCLSMGLLGFISVGTLWASWIWMSVFLPRLGTFSAIMSSKLKIYAPFFLFLLIGPL